MLGDKDGVYTESNDSAWPSNLKYHYNAERSGCIDSNGNELINALSYDSINNTVNLLVNSTTYCYLYFDLDGVAPQSFEFYLGGLSNPDYTNNPSVDVYINYSDNDISHYCVTEENTSENCNWNETSSSPVNTTYTLSNGDGLKIVYAYTKDLAGNISEQVIDTINLDTEKPTGNTISINSNATYTQSTSVTLVLASTGATEMCISNSNSCDSWEPYATSKSWTLTSTDGNKTVYVWYKDNAENISDVVSDTITLDSAAPSSNSVSINNNDAYTTSTSVTLTLKSTGATKMCISNSSSCTSYVDYATGYSWTLASGLGSKTVYVYFKDDAGNISSVTTDTINLYSVISTVPSQNGTLTYSGSAQSPSWSNYDSTKLTLGGTTSGTNAGTYSATFTPKTNYIWNDGTRTAKTVTWSIGKASGSLSLNKSSATINIDATTITTVTRSGDGKISVSNSDSTVATATLDGTTITIKGLKKGTTTITVSVASGTNHTAPGNKTIAVTVNRIVISTVPSQNGTLTYTGSVQSPSWSNYDSNQLTLGGTISGTNAISYNATFTPKTNYEWSDGTTTAKTVAWKINKAAGSLTLSSGSTTINQGASTTVTVTRAGNGTISATSSATGVADVSVSGTTLTIKGVGVGTATITVSVAEGTNHSAPGNKTASVTVNFCASGTQISTCIVNAKPLGYNTLMEAGLYRFQGTNSTVNNYICFGTNDKTTCTENIDKYMYRIIGINSSNQLKLIKNETLDTAYAWHSSLSTNIMWPQSDLYKGINGSYFLNNTTYVPSGWNEKIATVSWKYGDNTTYSIAASDLYQIENGWSNTVNAKIGLWYLHDYYYAYQSGGNICTYSGDYTNCASSWAFIKNCDTDYPSVYEWFISRYGINTDTGYYAFRGGSSGATNITGLNSKISVRPSFFLASNVSYVSGSGTKIDPIIIQ